jgi:hypothetical protein
MGTFFFHQTRMPPLGIRRYPPVWPLILATWGSGIPKGAAAQEILIYSHQTRPFFNSKEGLTGQVEILYGEGDLKNKNTQVDSFEGSIESHFVAQARKKISPQFDLSFHNKTTFRETRSYDSSQTTNRKKDRDVLNSTVSFAAFHVIPEVQVGVGPRCHYLFPTSSSKELSTTSGMETFEGKKAGGYFCNWGLGIAKSGAKWMTGLHYVTLGEKKRKFTSPNSPGNGGSVLAFEAPQLSLFGLVDFGFAEWLFSGTLLFSGDSSDAAPSGMKVRKDHFHLFTGFQLQDSRFLYEIQVGYRTESYSEANFTSFQTIPTWSIAFQSGPQGGPWKAGAALITGKDEHASSELNIEYGYLAGSLNFTYFLPI